MQTNKSSHHAGRWTLLAKRTRAMTDVMLHIASDAIADFPEDVERLERVRRFLYLSLVGLPREPPPIGDLLFVLGALIDVFGLDCDDPEVRAAIDDELEELLGKGAAGSRTSSKRPSA